METSNNVKLFLFLLVLALYSAGFSRGDLLHETPEQIHIAYGDTPDSMVITWSTSSLDGDEVDVVYYGASEATLDSKVLGSATYWTFGNEFGLKYTHTATITGLTAGQVYYYQCATGDHKSEVYFFTAMPAGSDWVQKFLVFGDMGKDEWLGIPQALPSLINQVKNEYPIAAIHVGDFAYDLDSLGGIQGDVFMRQIEEIAAYIPYMVCVGNHEDNYNYSHYINRFKMPNYNATSNMWYSWNIGLVHFIAYSTETVFYNADGFETSEQLAWLQQDLIQANQERSERPWIIAYGHRPFYCSNTDHDDCTNLKGLVRATFEDLFYDYGVDIILEAHEHSYERLWPVYNETTVLQFNYTNPKAPVHLISGAAGCNENGGFCINPILNPAGPWSAFRSSGITTYGYARMEIHNATHLYYEELQALNGDAILDSLWVVQNSHGPWA